MARRELSAPTVRAEAVEENLPDYDQYELQKERELVAKSEACFESAKLATEEMRKLGKEKSSLDKKIPDYKKIIKEIDKKIAVNKGVADLSCRLRHPGCVETQDKKIIEFPKSIGDEINKRNGTRIDFKKLVMLEGGEHTAAYIPWWPHLVNDKPVIMFYPNIGKPNIPRLAGGYGGEPSNKSGATVGVGVDLGQYESREFLGKMKKWNSGEHAISEAELEALHKKITPYFQLIGGEACKFLREHPFELNERQTIFLDNISQSDALEKTIRFYKDRTKGTGAKDFVDLTVEQQTSLLSNTYQYGKPKPLLLRAIVEEERSLIPEKIREWKYLFNSMPSDE